MYNTLYNNENYLIYSINSQELSYGYKKIKMFCVMKKKIGNNGKISKHYHEIDFGLISYHIYHIACFRMLKNSLRIAKKEIYYIFYSGKISTKSNLICSVKSKQ